MPEPEKYRDRPYNKYGSIRRVNPDGTTTWVTREQYEQSIRGVAGRVSARNPQTRRTIRNWRATGRGAMG